MGVHWKKLLLINAWSMAKLFILEQLKRLWVYIICADKEIKSFAESYVTERIIYDSENDLYNKIEIRLETGKIDWAITYREDDIIVTSKVIDKFGFKWNWSAVTKNIRNKYNFRKTLNQRYFKELEFFSYKLNSKNISAQKDLIKYPCVIKPVFWASSCFVTYIKTFEELCYYTDIIESHITIDIESALTDGIEIFVESYMPWDEIDIDILVQNWEIKFFSITDNLPSLKPFMIEKGQTIPSKFYFSQKKNILKQITTILQIFWITDSCLHFESKILDGKLYPIEINLRMWWDEVYYFVKESFWVDLIENSVKIAFWIEIEDLSTKIPIATLCWEYILPDTSWILEKFDIESTMFNKIYKTKKIWDKIEIPPNWFDFLGWFIVKGDTYPDCMQKLEQWKKSIHILIKQQC